VSLRYFNVFGPRQDPKGEYAAVVPKFVVCALRGERPVVFGDGEQTRDFCYIDNVVAANMLAATATKKLAGEVVNVACGESVSLNGLLRAIEEVAAAEGVSKPGAKLEPEHRPARPGDVRDSLADISAARALLGYEAKVDLREGLRRTMRALR
jgi:nucleoside-diphosphate-sugar epimerase